MDSLETQIYKAGYVRCPNHPNRWYASGPGLLEPLYHFASVIDGSDCTMRGDTMVYDDRIEVTESCRPTKVVATFKTVEEFFDHCALFGAISEPGLPAFSNSWD